MPEIKIELKLASDECEWRHSSSDFGCCEIPSKNKRSWIFTSWFVKEESSEIIAEKLKKFVEDMEEKEWFTAYETEKSIQGFNFSDYDYSPVTLVLSFENEGCIDCFDEFSVGYIKDDLEEIVKKRFDAKVMDFYLKEPCITYKTRRIFSQ